jgi:hypothetical protein
MLDGKRPSLSELTFTSDREKFRDPSYLPSRQEVIDSFKDGTSGDWGIFLQGRKGEEIIREVLTQEFVTALSDYLIERVENICPGNQPVTILEICSGNGRLAHFLNEKLAAGSPRQIIVMPTDLAKDKIVPNYPVQAIEHSKALSQYKPKVVICSWMPYDTDLSAEIREQPTVEEYILIGPLMACGRQWKTWGEVEQQYIDDPEELEFAFSRPKPFKEDGFEMVEIPEINKTQISNRVLTPGDKYEDSKTYSFRRKSEKNG